MMMSFLSCFESRGKRQQQYQVPVMAKVNGSDQYIPILLLLPDSWYQCTVVLRVSNVGVVVSTGSHSGPFSDALFCEPYAKLVLLSEN